MLSFEVLERDGIPAARAATECDEFSVEATAADTVIDTAASGLLYTSNAFDAHRPVTWMILSDAPSFQCDYQTNSEAVQTVDLSRLFFSDRYLEKQLAHFDD